MNFNVYYVIMKVFLCLKYQLWWGLELGKFLLRKMDETSILLFWFCCNRYTPSAEAEWSSTHPRHKRKGIMRDKEIVRGIGLLLWEKTKAWKNNNFHVSGKRYPVKPPDIMLKRNRKKSCNSNLIKLGVYCTGMLCRPNTLQVLITAGFME